MAVARPGTAPGPFRLLPATMRSGKLVRDEIAAGAKRVPPCVIASRGRDLRSRLREA